MIVRKKMIVVHGANSQRQEVVVNTGFLFISGLALTIRDCSVRS